MNPTQTNEMHEETEMRNLVERHEVEMRKLVEQHAAEIATATTRCEAKKAAKLKLVSDAQNPSAEHAQIKVLRQRQIRNHEMAMYDFDEKISDTQNTIRQLRQGEHDESLRDEYRTRLYVSDDDSIEILRAFAVRKLEDEIVKSVATITRLTELIDDTYLGLKDDFILRRQATLDMQQRSEAAWELRNRIKADPIDRRSEMAATLHLD
jgi:hypothetical protein